eukprot:Nk52_evm9s251 gene=Nk52_evmTU9s251
MSKQCEGIEQLPHLTLALPFSEGEDKVVLKDEKNKWTCSYTKPGAVEIGAPIIYCKTTSAKAVVQYVSTRLCQKSLEDATKLRGLLIYKPANSVERDGSIINSVVKKLSSNKLIHIKEWFIVDFGVTMSADCLGHLTRFNFATSSKGKAHHALSSDGVCAIYSLLYASDIMEQAAASPVINFELAESKAKKFIDPEVTTKSSANSEEQEINSSPSKRKKKKSFTTSFGEEKTRGFKFERNDHSELVTINVSDLGDEDAGKLLVSLSGIYSFANNAFWLQLFFDKKGVENKAMYSKHSTFPDSKRIVNEEKDHNSLADLQNGICSKFRGFIESAAKDSITKEGRSVITSIVRPPNHAMGLTIEIFASKKIITSFKVHMFDSNKSILVDLKRKTSFVLEGFKETDKFCAVINKYYNENTKNEKTNSYSSRITFVYINISPEHHFPPAKKLHNSVLNAARLMLSYPSFDFALAKLLKKMDEIFRASYSETALGTFSSSLTEDFGDADFDDEDEELEDKFPFFAQDMINLITHWNKDFLQDLLQEGIHSDSLTANPLSLKVYMKAFYAISHNEKWDFHCDTRASKLEEVINLHWKAESVNQFYKDVEKYFTLTPKKGIDYDDRRFSFINLLSLFIKLRDSYKNVLNSRLSSPNPAKWSNKEIQAGQAADFYLGVMMQLFETALTVLYNAGQVDLKA